MSDTAYTPDAGVGTAPTPAPEPSFDNLFPEKSKEFDDLFPPSVEAARDYAKTLKANGGAPYEISGDFAAPLAGAIGRATTAFGTGVKESEKSLGPYMSENEAKRILPDIEGIDEEQKKINEVTRRKFANSQTLLNTLEAIFRLGVADLPAGVQEMANSVGAEFGYPRMGDAVASGIGAFMGSPHPTGIPKRFPEVVERARPEITPESAPQVTDTPPAQEPASTPVEAGPITTQAVVGEVGPAAPAEPLAPDVHAVARSIDPDTFKQYDALQTRQLTFRRWIEDLRSVREQEAEANAPHASEIQDTVAKINDPDTTPRLKKKYQARLDEMSVEYDNFIEAATSKDSTDMAKIREKLQQTDYAMRGLAPNVAKAYQAARERIPQEEKTEPPEAIAPEQSVSDVVPVNEPVSESGQRPEQALENVTVAAEPTKVESETATLPQASPELKRISVDVANKLVAAGRPAEEAEAAGKLIAAHYWARAQRFNGAKGSGLDLYKAEAPDIKAGRERRKVVEFAQPSELKQATKGKLKVAENARNTITLFKSADASTFIHETGHQWLEELMQDARDQAAPDDIVADSDTVRKWLGVKDGKSISRSQHEKFARGFETYMMEGTAPSKALAKVFAKFKAWLTQIYQTAQGLRSPITDDIRDVFDRLLSTKPEKTVIVPERELPKSFADEHEAKVETAPPELARDNASQIQIERDNIAVEHAAEDQDARLEGVASGVGRREARSTESDRHGDEAEPDAGKGGAVAEHGTVGESGSEVAPEGAGPLPEPKVTTEVPPSAGAPFPRGDTPRVDKIGNFRIDGINLPEDVDAALREAAERRNGFVSERRGVVTDGDAMNLALASGVDTAWLDRKKIGDAYSKEEIFLLEHLFTVAATSVKDAAANVKPGDQASLLNFMEARQRLEMLQSKLAGATAEAGRALGAVRHMVKRKFETTEELNAAILKETGLTLFQMEQIAGYSSKLDSPARIAKMVRDTRNGKVKQAIVFYYVNALISGPITHARYAAGNALTIMWEPLVKTPISAAISAGRHALRAAETAEDAERVYLGESGAELYAILKGSREGWKAAVEGWQSGNTPNLPGEGMPDMIGAQPAVPPIPGALGYALGVPGKAVGAIHGFFSAIRYEQEVSRLAYRQAMQEGFDGTAFKDRVADLSNNPTADMTERASQVARKDFYMAPTEFDSLAGKLTRAANHNILTKVIVPFMKIGTQITRNALIEQSPLGVFDQKVRDNLSGKNGGAARDQQAGSIVGGTALIGTVALMAAEGTATGDGPSDPNKRRVWLLNHKPNSLQIGNITVPFQGLGSLGMLMRMSVNMYEAGHYATPDESHTMALDFLYGFEKAVLDENFMRGVKDMIDAVYHSEEYGERYIMSMATNWMPYSVGAGQIARETDPYQRETYAQTFLGKLGNTAQAKIPYWSQSLLPRRDMFGEMIPTHGATERYANDPVVKRLNSLQVGIGRLTHKIKNVELTPEEYDDYARVSGQMTKLRLTRLMLNPGFDNLPNGVKIDQVHKAVTAARATGEAYVISHHAAELIPRVREHKIEKRQGHDELVQ